MTDVIRVLHVEDDDDIVTIVRLSLGAESGFDVRAASSQQEAEGILSDDTWQPDVVLLDVHLGAASGLTLLDRLRIERPALPVILMTASVSSKELEMYRKVAITEVIAKPFDPLSLGAMVRARLPG